MPLSLTDLRALYDDATVPALTDEAEARVQAGAARVAEAAAGDRAIYGINTGFGKLASTRIGRDDVETLQRNLIMSHSAGVGRPAATRGDAAGDVDEGGVAGERRVGRPVADHPPHPRHAGAGLPAGGAGAGLGRRLGRPRPARPHGGGR